MSLIPGSPSWTLAQMLEAHTGQKISAARSWRIEAAVRPILRSLEMATLGALTARIAQGDDALAVQVTEALLNNETSFFRDMAVFELFDKSVLDGVASSRRHAKRLRLWSAGCSTGQEAYTLAMLVRDGGPRWSGWTVEILATDVSASAVARGRSGRYSQFEIQRGLPVRTMLRWFRQDGEEWVADATLRRAIRFGTHNLLLAPPGRFDAILCRNVLMYFQPAVRAQVFDRLATALDPGGVLILGAGETVIGQTDRFIPHPDWRGVYGTTRDFSASNPMRRTG